MSDKTYKQMKSELHEFYKTKVKPLLPEFEQDKNDIRKISAFRKVGMYSFF